MKLSRIGIAAALLFAANAVAQVSGKPVQMISGYAPGGNVDILARLFAEKWGEAIGRPVVVVNRVGAGGQIGLEMVKAAPPDGNMLIVTPDASLVLRPLMMKTAPYDPLKDFAAVAHAGEQDYVFAIGGGLPAKDLREFAAWAKANPAQANFGAGQGGSTQFIGILIGQAIGVPLQTIPYTGSGQNNYRAARRADCIGGATARNGAGSGAGRQDPLGRHHGREARTGVARHADHGRTGPSLADSGQLVRHLRATRHAGRNRVAVEWHLPQSRQNGSDEGQAR